MGTRVVRPVTLPALAALLAASGAAAAGPAPAVSAAVSRPAGTAAHALAAPGARLWISRFAGGGGRTVYVTGNSTGKGTGRDVTTVAYRAATGARLWLERYGGPGRGFDGARAIAVSPGGGRVFVTGTSTGPGPGGSQDVVTIAYRG